MIEEEETKEQLENLIETHGSENIRLVFYFKFGTDGSSGHIVANQIGSMENSGKLMSSNMIILQLVAFVEGQENPIIIHTNQLYNSEISNRPLGHQYIPETTGIHFFFKFSKKSYFYFTKFREIPMNMIYN